MTGEPELRGVVNGVLYPVQFEPSIEDEAVVADRVEQLLSAPLFGQPVPRMVAALWAALAGGGPLATGIPQPHDEAAVRTFLARVPELRAAEALPTGTSGESTVSR